MSAWTQEEDDKLRILWRDGHSCSVIAGRMPGRTRNAIIGRVRRLDLSFRGYRPGGIVAKRNAGLIPRKPAKSERASKPLSPAAQVIKAIRKDGLPIPPPQETDIPRVSLMDLERHHCKWVCADAGHALYDARYCGERIVPGTSYCAPHLVRATSSPNPARPGQQFQLRSLEVA